MQNMESKKKNGRPSIFTQKLGNLICSRVAAGESLRRICLDERMPARRTVHLWLLEPEKISFLRQYETASDIRTDEKFEEIEEMADDESREVQRSRLKVDTRKWYLSKIMPKKYGDKLDLTSDNKPLAVSAEDVALRVANLLNKG